MITCLVMALTLAKASPAASDTLAPQAQINAALSDSTFEGEPNEGDEALIAP